jgi:S1-C subfamily serine protease
VRKLLATPLVSAVVGGGVTAAVLIGTGVVDDGQTRTVYEQNPLGPSQTLTARAIYNRDAPGVAYIRARRLQGSGSPFDLTHDTDATGSGFVIDDQGRILTNAHVIDSATQVSVTLADKTRRASVIGKDEATDLAVLKVDPEGLDLHPLALGDSDAVHVGDPTVAIGNPFGYDRTLTTGVVSALQRQISSPQGYTIEDVIQTDAVLNPGNSGGPLIDGTGRVIGVNSQIADGSVGIGFAVPVDTAKRVVRDLLAHGRVDRPWLGIQFVAITPAMADLDLGGRSGLLVQHVEPNGPAAAAGVLGGDSEVGLNTGQEMVLGGDIVTKVGGTVVRDADDLRRALDAHDPGDTVELEVQRDGTTRAMPVTLQNRPAGRLDG